MIGLPGQLEPREIEVPDGEPDPWGPQSELHVVGSRVPRLDAVAKVTGAATYTYDVQLPGMLHARILRCPHPAARVARVDASAALRHAGVRAVLTFEGRTARYQGEEVAAVAAETPEIAAEALALFTATYEPIPWVVDLEAARADGAPRVLDEPNVRPPTVREKGDAIAALAASKHVVELCYRTQVETHCCLETHGVVASWEGEELTVWASTQATFAVRDELADALQLPKSHVKVITEYMGGGFGSKFGAGSFSVIAARLAKKAGAPVKLMLKRKEEHLATGNRPNAVMRLRAGAGDDGKLTAFHLVSYGTAGVGTGAGVSGAIRNTYDVPAYRTEESDVLTNTGPGQPMRAPGHPQGAFALEQTVDELAIKVGMDPLAYRRHIDTHPVRLAQYEVGASAIGWERRGAIEAENRAATGPLRRGIGMASGVWYNTGGPGATVHVRIHGDGSVEALSGSQDIGTGTRTFIGMVAAEELGLPLAHVTVRLGRTEWPEGPGSGGSSTTPTLSPAVRSAAHAARRKMIELAAEILETDLANVELLPGPIFARRDGSGERLGWDDVARHIRAGTLTAQGERLPDHAGGFDRIAGVQFAEVTVDVATGKVRVVKVVAIHDCGRVINPMLVESQINGGVINGVSFALHEERILDPQSGRMLNANLEQYKISGALDVPEIVVIPLHVEAGFSNTGSLGIGESPIIPTAAAIANAVFHATGVRVKELPMTPARVLAALRTDRA
ncbi:MAG: xanthine dehydrogenase family protein molybdopterin-binding subunit [Acidobacteriota bacterium]